MSSRSQGESLAPPSRALRSSSRDIHQTTPRSSSYRSKSTSSRGDASAHDLELDVYTAEPSIRVEHHDGSVLESATSTLFRGHRRSRETDRTNDHLVDDHGQQYEVYPKSNKIEKVTSNRTNSDPTSTSSRGAKSPRKTDPDTWSETGARVNVPRRNLTELDVAALIFNKMIGTGIFTTPGAVLALTKSREISMALWTVGGVWTFLFLLVYLEYGTALPYNGGELIYLDAIYYKPELFFTIVFSGFFLLLGNSYGNSISFAKNILLSADLTKAQTSELDARLVRFVAIAVVSLVCLLHYFSSRAGLFLNKALFWYKSLLLLVVLSAGIHHARKHGNEWNNYNGQKQRGSSMDCLAAMISIFYTYQGWENANYIAGEIRGPEGGTPAKTLKIGAFLAVGLVWCLYVLVTLAYYMVLDFDSITDKHSDLGMAIHFAPKVFGSSMGMRVCIALSAFGNVLAVTYTSTRVKQAIARQRILPFWKFFALDPDTPKGALALHWVSTVIIIAACPTSSDGYIFATGLFTYGHLIFSSFVTFGLFWLQRRMHEEFAWSFLKWYWLRIVVIVLFVGGNLLVLSLGAKSQVPGKIPRYWWPATIASICFGSFLYWGVMRILMIEYGPFINGEKRRKTIGTKVGFEINVMKADGRLPQKASQALEDAIIESQQDGTNRRVVYHFTGGFRYIGKAYMKIQNFVAKYLF